MVERLIPTIEVKKAVLSPTKMSLTLFVMSLGSKA